MRRIIETKALVELEFLHECRKYLSKGSDTVGELGRVENCASRMASLKAQDHGNAYAERLAWESGNRFANSIGSFFETRKLREPQAGRPETVPLE